MNLSTKSALLAACLLGASAAFAAGDTASGADRGAATDKQTARTPLTDAVVKKVDKAAGTVTLDAGPLPSGMPAMTMDYRLKDPSWFGRLKEGQKIRIAVEEIRGELTVVRFEPADR